MSPGIHSRSSNQNLRANNPRRAVIQSALSNFPMTSELEDLQQQIAAMHPAIDDIEAEIARAIVGQRYLVERLLIGLLANGHVLLEGVPGLAKTATISALAQCIHTKFSRIQFTPDLLPSDLVGNLIYNPREGKIGRAHV